MRGKRAEITMVCEDYKEYKPNGHSTIVLRWDNTRKLRKKASQGGGGKKTQTSINEGESSEGGDGKTEKKKKKSRGVQKPLFNGGRW